MQQRVLILGGTGGIGRAVAADILQHTQARVTLAGRRAQPRRSLPAGTDYRQVDVMAGNIATHLAGVDLVVHCAGPFRQRDQRVLAACLEQQIAYVDVADSPDYVEATLTYSDRADAQGVTGVISTGVFPGVSNSLVRQGIEQFDRAETVHLSYLVAGSGGAGLTVMRTTFVELQTPFLGKVKGEWREIAPYCDREILPFPAPYNVGAGVYWYNTVEARVLPRSFPQLKTCITKFGSLPDYYNRLTQLMTRLPNGWLQQPAVIEFLAQVSYRMTQVTDRFTGLDIALRLEIKGLRNNNPATYLATFTHPDTAQVAGMGTGSIVEKILTGDLQHPGIHTVEQVLDTATFQELCQSRQLTVHEQFLWDKGSES
ncbi:MAG: saccharopine dehydrogenase NADP-binding domain-containing protein [Cyanobacteria bacterium P01_A01_bin.105]